ncbi:MAG: hypothetical protein ACM30I_00310 [Gemmatimonas sp.]
MAVDDRYRAFAEWRLSTHRTGKGRSVRFFRLTRDHTVIWSTVMRGHYVGKPPTIQECITEVRCSKETARRIIVAAQARGYFQIRPAPDDARKRLVTPSRQCVAEYQAMVDGYLELPDILGVAPRRAK